MKQVRAGSVIPMVRNLGLFFTAILAVFAAVIGGQLPSGDNPYVPALSSKFYYEKGRNVFQSLSDKVDYNTLKAILMTELPVMSIVEDHSVAGWDRSRIVTAGLNLLAGVRLEDPLTYLKAEIPMMEITPVTADSFDETGVDEISEAPSPENDGKESQARPELNNTISSDIPLIALYNTHSSETFELTDGLAHLKWKAGGVTIVAAEIKKAIEEKYGIAVTFNQTIHDKSFNRSYIESEKTIKELLNANRDLEMVFDIHRDGALTREQSLTEINGQKVAKILIVVGTDARAEHPDWKENLQLARQISAKLDSMYPGLSRGIAIKQGRYNQQYSTRALLVEIGSAKNTTDEAVLAGRMFADVIVAVLNDLRAGSGE